MLDRFNPPGTEGPFPERFLAVFVFCNNHPTQYHCGLLFRNGSEEVSALHLAWHVALRNEPFESMRSYSGWAVPPLDDLAIPSFLWRCERIAERANTESGRPNDWKITYGLHYDERMKFNRNSTAFEWGPEGVGLTCATFVLAVFQSERMPLVKYDDWPTLSDSELTAWRKQVEQDLFFYRKKYPVSAEHWNDLRKEKVRTRYTPAQICGASVQPGIPALHAVSTAAGTKIVSSLQPRPR